MLIVIGSPWQALLAKSYILKEKITHQKYVIEKSSQKSYSEIIKILDVNEADILLIIEWEKLSVRSFSKAAVASAYISHILEALKDKKFKEVSKVLIFSEQTVFCKILYDVFGNDKIYIKSEDGILDYLSKLKDHTLFTKVMGYVFMGAKVKYYIYKNNFPVFRNVVMFRKLNEVSIHQFIPLSTFKTEFLKVLSDSYEVDPKDDIIKDKDVLLLCQSLSEDKVMPLKDELDLYRRFIKRCNEEKLSVIIKPHPRSCAEKIDALVKLTSDSVIFFENYGIPAESLLLHGKFKEVVGVYTNTIIYSNEFFGVKGISLLTPAMINLLKGKDKKKFSYIHGQLRGYFKNEYAEFQ